MSKWATSLVGHMGCGGVLMRMHLENVFPPIPSELIMRLAGFTSAQGFINFVMVSSWVSRDRSSGSFRGTTSYAGGFASGISFEWADQDGKWLTLPRSDADRGGRLVQPARVEGPDLCRLAPGLHSLISIPGGAREMPMRNTLACSLPGTVVWILQVPPWSSRARAHHERDLPDHEPSDHRAGCRRMWRPPRSSCET